MMLQGLMGIAKWSLHLENKHISTEVINIGISDVDLQFKGYRFNETIIVGAALHT